MMRKPPPRGPECYMTGATQEEIDDARLIERQSQPEWTICQFVRMLRLKANMTILDVSNSTGLSIEQVDNLEDKNGLGALII